MYNYDVTRHADGKTLQGVSKEEAENFARENLSSGANIIEHIIPDNPLAQRLLSGREWYCGGVGNSWDEVFTRA
jgi:hypothetical protein